MSKLLHVLLLFLFAIGTFAQSGSQNKSIVKFKDFPSNEKLRNRIIRVIESDFSTEKIKTELEKLVNEAGIKSCHVDFTTKKGESFIWYHNERINQYTVLFATRGGYGAVENYGVLLDQWRDTLFVIDTMVLSIDSSIYKDNLIGLRCLDESAGQNITIKTEGRISTVHSIKAHEEDQYFQVELSYKSRKEVMTICFLGTPMKEQLKPALHHYLPFDYSDSELCQVVSGLYPHIKNLDEGSLHRFIRTSN